MLVVGLDEAAVRRLTHRLRFQSYAERLKALSVIANGYAAHLGRRARNRCLKRLSLLSVVSNEAANSARRESTKSHTVTDLTPLSNVTQRPSCSHSLPLPG
jgi:hypothetical protein